MSGFFDKLLSGKYPNSENVLLAEFRRVMDEVFTQPDLDEPVEASVGVRGELERVRELLAEERSRLELARRELGVERAQRKALQYKLDRVLQAAMEPATHAEPL